MIAESANESVVEASCGDFREAERTASPAQSHFVTWPKDLFFGAGETIFHQGRFRPRLLTVEENATNDRSTA
jgi:hypothetical protein